ncbi:hypothetical protein Tco_1363610 [Tanacetum coccineum]
MRELREGTFFRNKNNDARELVKEFWTSLSPGTINTWDLFKKAFIQRYCPPSKTARQLEEIHNFNQDGNETLYQAWERYNDLQYKCPTHDLNCHQKVNIFYKGLDTMTRQQLDSQRPIPNKTPAQALTVNQTMVDHSKKWHDGSASRRVIDDNSNKIASIDAKPTDELISTRKVLLRKSCSGLWCFSMRPTASAPCIHELDASSGVRRLNELKCNLVELDDRQVNVPFKRTCVRSLDLFLSLDQQPYIVLRVYPVDPSLRDSNGVYPVGTSAGRLKRNIISQDDSQNGFDVASIVPSKRLCAAIKCRFRTGCS